MRINHNNRRSDMEETAINPSVLKERDAAKFLGVSVKTLQSWRWRKKGPEYLKYGDIGSSAVRYEISALENFKNQSKVRA